MNKRQRKKLLYKAIRELNNHISHRTLNYPLLIEEEVRSIYRRIKDDKEAVKDTLYDYAVYRQLGVLFDL